MTSPNNMRLLSRAEVEEAYGVPKRYLEVAISMSGGPRFVRIGRLVRYRVCDIEAWIEGSLSPEVN